MERTVWRSIAGIAVLLLSDAAIADTFGDAHSFEARSPDGRYTLVMIASVPPREDGSTLNDAAAERVRSIRDRYAVSGLYLTGGLEPLWTIGQFEQSVLVSNDGAHVVAYEFVPDSPSDVVLRFYKNGKLGKSYTLEDLVWHRRVARSASGLYVWLEDIQLDESNDGVTLVVSGKRTISIDFSGTIRQTEKVSRQLLLIGALVVVGIAVVLLGISKRRRTSRASEN